MAKNNVTKIKQVVRKPNNPNAPVPAQPQTEEERRSWPQFNAFRDFVTTELNRRRNSYPGPVSAPFVRLTSCKQDKKSKYAYFTLGLHGFDNQDINLFDQAFNSKVDIVGYAYDLTAQGRRPKRLVSSDELHAAPLFKEVQEQFKDNKKILDGITNVQQQIIQQQKTVFAAGSHPIPGITSVTVSRQGIGTPMIATVHWSCYNRAQLEFLRNHFMITGGYVVLEWGQNFADKQPKKILDFSDPEVHKELVKVVLLGRRYITKQWVQPNDGNYDFLVGYIGNFTIDFDAQSNIYDCSLTIYGAGENLFGINSYLTFVDKVAPTDSNEAHKPSSIHEFFKPNGAFDIMVRQAASDSKPSVAKFKVDWSRRANGGYADAEEFKQYSSNPSDARFVSWEFFTKTVVPELFKLLRSDRVMRELEQTMMLDDDESVSPAAQSWIGDHPALRSTDPDVMVIVKRDANTVDDAAFAGIGYFGEESESKNYRGKLNHGVWLNTDAIRYAFTATNTFRAGIVNLLDQMNNAVANYWGLMFFYDEELGKYRIVDSKHINVATVTKFYKFNEGAKGETLAIMFESAFPPELITQMALFSYFKTTDPNRRSELLNEYPSIGTTSTFMFALNWTDLDDILDRELAEARKQNTKAASDQLPTVLETSKQAMPVRTDTRVTDTKNVTALNNQGKGQPIGSISNLQNVSTAAKTKEDLTDTTIKASTHTIKAPWNNPEAELMYQRSLKYKTLVETHALANGIDPDLVRAIIAQESSFVPGQLGEGRVTGGRGLMQIVYSTARDSGFTGTRDELLDNVNSVKYGCRHFRDRLTQNSVFWTPDFAKCNGDVEAAISMYNLGNRNAATGVGIRSKPGNRFGNQQYVNRVMGFYNYFRSKNNKEPLKTGDTVDRSVLTPPPKVDSDADAQKATLAPATANIGLKEADATTAKFGASSVMKYIKPQPTSMIAEITKTGPEDYAARRPNSFVAPFPTTTSVSVDILGISGISVTDGFYVDKLPFIFESYGCFQVTEVMENISTQGWTTRITGYFKLLWMNGEGAQ